MEGNICPIENEWAIVAGQIGSLNPSAEKRESKSLKFRFGLAY